MESHNRSIAKSISFRIVASFLTFLTILVFTGDLSFSGVIGGVDFVTKIVLFYLHERVWLKVPWGRESPVKHG